jgi:predicted Rossmann-fold nucleotide-binding protein
MQTVPKKSEGFDRKRSALPGLSLPYEPIPQQLYTPVTLFQGFKPDEPASWGQTVDFAIYRHFVMEGRDAPTNPYFGMMQALHDNAITQWTDVLIAGRRIAAIMGDHIMRRDSAVYRDIAILSRRLTRSGILMSSGGGSGAMEAIHLGALLAAGADPDLEEALALLKTQPVVPALRNIVNSKGRVNPVLVAQAHAWFKPAYEIYSSISSPGQSLAFPTWHYGHEPATPFATHIAKYFQNSIREDGLLALAKQGIIYFEGKTGTIQEIFQDGNQNYYKMFDCFSPMVLFGVEYWTTKYPVVGVLQKLFTPSEFAKYVLVTDDMAAAARFIEHFTT